jgi:threonine aldolase
VRVNLYSDTQTRPSPEMKAAMIAAELGDEQHGDDPTVHALCDRMAALLGKAASVFLPSGTMCNQIAILTHCRAGDEIIAHETAHIIANEGGGPAALTGASVLGLKGPRGQFDADTLRAAFREKRRNAPPQTLLEVEQTANLGGGTVWPLGRLNAVLDAAHAHGMATHMDGARLMNAVIAAGIPASEMVAGCDSVWVDFTKGLGAPLGAVLCGSADFIDMAWRWKQRRACMHWITTSTGWRMTMPMPKHSPADWHKSRVSRWKSRKPTWCSSTPAAPACPPTTWLCACASRA